MSTSEYSILIKPTDSPANTYFSGRFIVRNSDNVILNVYSTANPSVDLLIHDQSELLGVLTNFTPPGGFVFYEPTFVSSSYVFRAYLKNIDITIDRTLYNFYGVNENTVAVYLLGELAFRPFNTSYNAFSTVPNPGDGSLPTPLYTTQTITPYSSPSPPCYAEGTRILMEDSTEKTIENLCVGDIVMTYTHGPRRVTHVGCVDFINDPKKWYNCLFVHKESGLTITGGHSILVESLSPVEENIIRETNYPKRKIDGMYTLLSTIACSRFEQVKDNVRCKIYHFVVESDDHSRQYGVYANGILSETISYDVFVQSFERSTDIETLLPFESEKIMCA